jgi:mono/diheme cytochrome c family protein
MKILIAAALFLPMALAAGAPAGRPSASPVPSDANPRIERGRYLVHQVALCVQCHSPRDENGRLIGTRLLSGARIPVGSPFPGQAWAYQAPDIRGMVGYTEEEGIRFLTEGITRGGTPPRPPMQQFHLSRDDARDVVAYLKSLR